MTFLRLILLIFIICGMAGCAHMPHNPFLVPAGEIFGNVQKVVLCPVSLPQGVDEADKVKETFENLIENRMREAELEILPVKLYRKVWNKFAEQAGGYFDRRTGEFDKAKYEQVREQTQSEILAQYQAKAFLYAWVGVVRAPFVGFTASWHGIQESLGKVELTAQLLFSSAVNPQTRGTLPALSLLVSLEEPGGKALYRNGGGIQTLMKINPQGKFFHVPQEDILKDEERNSRAVNIALDPLIKKRGTGQGTAENPGEKK